MFVWAHELWDKLIVRTRKSIGSACMMTEMCKQIRVSNQLFFSEKGIWRSRLKIVNKGIRNLPLEGQANLQEHKNTVYMLAISSQHKNEYSADVN